MDWIQAGTAFGAAAAGAAAMMKTLDAIAKRKAAPEKERRSLFLNGDKEEVIRQMNRLIVRDRETDTTLARIESALNRISQRLDRAGILP